MRVGFEYRSMLRGVLKRLWSWFTDDEPDDSDGSRFVPSVLDASVRYAHGGSNPEGDRALSEIDEEAQRLEEQNRN